MRLAVLYLTDECSCMQPDHTRPPPAPGTAQKMCYSADLLQRKVGRPDHSVTSPGHGVYTSPLRRAQKNSAYALMTHLHDYESLYRDASAMIPVSPMGYMCMDYDILCTDVPGLSPGGVSEGSYLIPVRSYASTLIATLPNQNLSFRSDRDTSRHTYYTALLLSLIATCPVTG
jgi:hypothetical protein